MKLAVRGMLGLIGGKEASFDQVVIWSESRHGFPEMNRPLGSGLQVPGFVAKYISSRPYPRNLKKY